ncbi:hypothetical protein MJD09_15685, partial [bacterium]|nr:hypothetical protein [bacterium]
TFAIGAVWADSNVINKALVSAEWVKQHLNEKNIILLDISKQANFDQGHIMGAVNSYALKTFNPKQKGLLYEVGDKATVQSALRDLGVNEDSHVVIIWPDNELKTVYHAARTFFVLENYGVKVSILDGGMKAWRAAGYPTAMATKVVETGNISLGDFDTNQLAIMTEVKKSSKLFDNRPVSFFKGSKKKKFVAKAGTIKGASNLPFNLFFNDDWTFKKKEEIESIFAKNKATNGSIFFCNTGNLASVAWFAAEKIAGLDVKLYDGSMNEWANYAANPVECEMCE